MCSKLTNKEFQGMSSESNSPGLSTSTTENSKEDLSSGRLKLSPETSKTIRNATSPFTILDYQYSTKIQSYGGTDSSPPAKKARISKDFMFELEHNYSANSFEPEAHFKEIQSTRNYKPRNSTPKDHLQCFSFSAEFLESISSVTNDDDQERNVNQDNLNDVNSFLLDQQLNKCSSTFNTTATRSNLENSIPLSNYVPLPITETNLVSTHCDYVTAKDFKLASKDTDVVESRLIEISTIVTEKVKPLQYQWTQCQSQDVLTSHKSSSSIASNSSCFTLGSEFEDFDDFDTQIESAKKEFDLESISDEDLDCDNIYEELCNILSEDVSSKENTFISTPNPDDLLKHSTGSTLRLNAYSGYDNMRENSILTESDSAKDVLQSSFFFPADEHQAETEISYKTKDKSEFSEDISCKEAMNETMIRNTMRELIMSTAFLLENEPIADTSSDDCYTEHHGCNNAPSSDHFVSYRFSTTNENTHMIVDDSASTKDEIHSPASLDTSATTYKKCSGVNINNDILGHENMSNCLGTFKTIEDSFWSPLSHSSSENYCLTTSDRNGTNLPFNSSITEHVEISDVNDITISKPNNSRVQTYKENITNEIGVYKIVSDYKNTQLCENYEDPNTFYNSSITPTQISIFGNKNKIPDILNEETLVNSTQKYEEYIETPADILLNQENANIEKIQREFLYDVGHETPNKFLGSEFLQPSNNVSYIRDIEGYQKDSKSSARSGTERNSLFVDCSRINIEPLSDSYVDEKGELENNGHTEMDQLSGVNSNLITYPQSSISDDITKRNSLVLDYNRIKTEPLPDSYVNETENMEISGYIFPSQLKELYDIDKIVTQAVLKTITHLDRNTGVRESQIVKYIKQHKIIPLQSKPDVSRFLKSACEVGIIKKNLNKYMLSDQVKTIAEEHEKGKKDATNPNVNTPLSREIDGIKQELSMPVSLPILLRCNKDPLKPGTPEPNVFKELRSRIVFMNK